MPIKKDTLTVATETQLWVRKHIPTLERSLPVVLGKVTTARAEIILRKHSKAAGEELESMLKKYPKYDD